MEARHAQRSCSAPRGAGGQGRGLETAARSAEARASACRLLAPACHGGAWRCAARAPSRAWHPRPAMAGAPRQGRRCAAEYTIGGVGSLPPWHVVSMAGHNSSTHSQKVKGATPPRARARGRRAALHCPEQKAGRGGGERHRKVGGAQSKGGPGRLGASRSAQRHHPGTHTTRTPWAKSALRAACARLGAARTPQQGLRGERAHRGWWKRGGGGASRAGRCRRRPCIAVAPAEAAAAAAVGQAAVAAGAAAAAHSDRDGSLGGARGRL
jgi:hypothetical protein